MPEVKNKEWFHISEAIPKRNEYVLVETRYCKYPAVVGFYNGVDWISAHDKCKIMNTRYWQYITLPE